MEKIDLKNLDNKQKTQIAVTAFLIITFIFIMGNSIRNITSSGTGTKESKIITPDKFKEIIDSTKHKTSITLKDTSVSKYKKEIASIEATGWGRDPFSKRSALLGGGEFISDFKLEGILWDESQPTAIINGEILKEGDKIGSAKIVQIQKDSVIINDGSKDYRLNL